MKKTLLLTMILALTTSVASADVWGWWESDIVGAFNRYTLKAKSTEGALTGFDMLVLDPGGGMNQTGPVYSTAVDDDTHFLFQKSHYVYGTGVVTDIAVGAEYEDANVLIGAFTATAGGIYAGGFTNPVAVCQIVTSAAGNPYDILGLESTGGGVALARVGTGGDARLEEIRVPEPSVLTLLVLGLGALAFGIRRR